MPVSVTYAYSPSGENVTPFNICQHCTINSPQFFVGLTIGMNKSISNDRHSASIGVESVNLILQTWRGTEILDIAIDCVGEIDIFVLWVNDNVVQGVELATEVVVQKN